LIQVVEKNAVIIPALFKNTMAFKLAGILLLALVLGGCGLKPDESESVPTLTVAEREAALKD